MQPEIHVCICNDPSLFKTKQLDTLSLEEKNIEDLFKINWLVTFIYTYVISD